MTKKEMMTRIYEAQKEINEAKEAIARGNRVLDALISELNAKEAPKDPSFIVGDNGMKWFLGKQAICALGFGPNTATKDVLRMCSPWNMRKASYYELRLLGAASTGCDVWLVSEVGLRDIVAHRRGKNRNVIPDWLGGDVTIKPIETMRQIIIRVLSDGGNHTRKELEDEITAAGYQRLSMSSTLDKMLKDNDIIRVSKGVYRIVRKAA